MSFRPPSARNHTSPPRRRRSGKEAPRPTFHARREREAINNGLMERAYIGSSLPPRRAPDGRIMGSTQHHAAHLLVGL